MIVSIPREARNAAGRRLAPLLPSAREPKRRYLRHLSPSGSSPRPPAAVGLAAALGVASGCEAAWLGCERGQAADFSAPDSPGNNAQDHGYYREREDGEPLTPPLPLPQQANAENCGQQSDQEPDRPPA